MFQGIGKLPAMAATMAAIALISGCGGGGSSSPTMGGDMPTGGLPPEQDRPRVAARMGDLAGNEPAPGSVTQSSNADSRGVTTDRITATPSLNARGLLDVVVRNTETNQRIASGDRGTNVLGDREAGSDGFGDDLLSSMPVRRLGLIRDVSDGRIYVLATTDRKAPENGSPDADYMVAGWWLHVPSDRAARVNVAAFADGGALHAGQYGRTDRHGHIYRSGAGPAE